MTNGYISPKDAATKINRSTANVLLMLTQGKLKGKKDDKGRWQVEDKSITAWLEANPKFLTAKHSGRQPTKPKAFAAAGKAGKKAGKKATTKSAGSKGSQTKKQIPASALHLVGDTKSAVKEMLLRRLENIVNELSFTEAQSMLLSLD